MVLAREILQAAGVELQVGSRPNSLLLPQRAKVCSAEHIQALLRV
jgi:hypothetical protein